MTVLIAARAAVAIREVFTMVDAVVVAAFRLNRWVRSYVARHVQRGVCGDLKMDGENEEIGI